MKSKWCQLSVPVIVLVLFFSLISPASKLLFMSDAFFVIGLLLQTIGLFGWVLKNGTFDFFHYSLSQSKDKFFRSQKINDSNKLNDKDRLHRLSRSIPSSYTSFLKAGGMFLLCAMICTVLYYL